MPSRGPTLTRKPDTPRILGTPWSHSDRPVPRAVVQPLQSFLHTELAGGAVMLVAAIVALVWANSPVAGSYSRLFETPLVVSAGPFEIAEDLRHWTNDLLMALFFFVVGLEIKRELVHGELRDPRAAALPMICAAGGMIAPALLYTSVNLGGPGAAGWGIPMATDIAFAVGVLALLGTRAPASLKVFLLTLAVVDDLGAIVVITVFYSAGLEAAWLGLAVLTVAAVLGMKRLQIRALPLYFVAAAVLWLALFESGVHATIAGVILGLLTPAWPFHPPEAVTGVAAGHLRKLRADAPDGVSDEREQAALLTVSRLTEEAVSPLARLEARLHPYAAYLVLPLFALANAGVAVSAEGLAAAAREPLTLGIVLGLVVGKPLGIMAAALLVVRSGLGRLPTGVGWLEILGVSGLAGVGFTVSIFVADLAFDDPLRSGTAKIGVLAASLLSGVIGSAALAARNAAKQPDAASWDVTADN